MGTITQSGSDDKSDEHDFDIAALHAAQEAAFKSKNMKRARELVVLESRVMCGEVTEKEAARVLD